MDVMKSPLILWHFFWVFSHVIDNKFEMMYLHKTFTDFTHFGLSICQMVLQVMGSSLIKSVFWEFSYLLHTYLKRYNSIKLLQIACKGRSVGLTSKPLL